MTRRIGVLISTYHRVDDARTAMEVIRSTWTAPWFDEVVLVHAFNGPTGSYRPSGLEDAFIEVPAEPSHFRGAASLLDAGLVHLAAQEPELKFAVATAADVWLYNPSWVARSIDRMHAGCHRLAGSSWEIDPGAHGLARNQAVGLLPIAGLSTDLLLLDLPWAFSTAGMLPLSYGAFLDRYEDLLNYAQEMPFLERYILGRFLGAIRRESTHAGGKDPWGSEGLRLARRALLLLEEREIIADSASNRSHKGHWPEIGLVTSEDPEVKRAIARERPELRGETLDRLRNSPNVGWYNGASS